MKTPLIALTLLAATTATAAATPASPTVSAVLEVTETTPQGKGATMRFDAAVTLDHGTTSLKATAGGASYEVGVARRSQGNEPPLTEIAFEQRRDHQQPIELHVTSRIEPGKRTSVAMIRRPDGSRFELSITLQ